MTVIARGLRKTINNLSVFPYKHELDEDEELEYQIKGAIVKLSALGVHVAGLAL